MEPKLLTNVTISGNTVASAPQYYGGGGLFAESSGITLTNSTITGNTVTVSAADAGGGGIYNYDGMSISGSTISGNTVLGSAAGSGGGGIFSYDDIAMLNTTINGNSSSIDGGGFMIYGTYTDTLTNVTLYQESRRRASAENIDNPYTMTSVTNSIVAGGTAPHRAGHR